MADVVLHKDVALAILGASAGLSGLVLVFLGFVIAAYTTLPGDASTRARSPYRRAGGVVLTALAIGLLRIASATIWLLVPDGTFGIYVTTIVLFLAQLIGLAVATVWTLRRLLWA